MAKANTDNPRAYARRMETRFHKTSPERRKDVRGVQDPRAWTLLETAAEVLGGLEKAFHDYDKKSEPAWS